MWERGVCDGGNICAGSTMGDGERKGRVKGVLKSAAGMPPGLPCGNPYSDGDVVAADMGKGR